MSHLGGLLPAFALAMQSGGSFWLPERGTASASSIDWVFYFILYISTFFFVVILAALVFMVLRYRKRDGREAEETAHHNLALELTWSIIPLVIVIIIFYMGFKGYLYDVTPPGNSYEVLVEGHKWKWAFTYPDGYVDEVLHVPAGRPVKLVLTSIDVIHSLFIPDFRIKKDAVPGRYNIAWFTAPVPGEHVLLCAEYCGTQHSDMITKVVVHDPAEFDKWLADASNFLARMSPKEAGGMLTQRRGCIQCHSIDGTAGTGPTFTGLYGSMVPLQDGATVKADENYIRESILEPQKRIAKGFQPVMPTFQGKLKDDEILAIIEYLKSISETSEVK